MEVPPGFLELLSNTLTPDPNLRLKAEEQLRFLEKTELQYPLVLIAIASDEHRNGVLRQLSLTLLKQYVLHSWSLSSERYTKNPQLEFLPQEQKSHIRQAMLHLLISPDHILRNIAANIVPKIAQADWPNDWPGFLEELSNVIEHSNNVTEVISVLKVLREFISETLTDESYFTVVPPINERLLAMQYNPSLLIRTKAQSVFRSCMEQMEMYKDTTTYRATVRSYIETTMGPWVTALNQNLAVDITTLSGDDYDAAVKLKHATFKTIVLLDRAFQSALERHLNPLLETVFSSLEAIYPYYQRVLSSPSVSPQLNRYVISLFGILQVILREPLFDPDSSERQPELANGAVIDQLFFTETVRFTQLPDEICAQWLEEPQSIIDDTANGLAVRTAVLSCADEHFQVSFSEIWLQVFHSASRDWRIEEALFSLVPANLADSPSVYAHDIALMREDIENGMRSQNPLVCAAAVSAAFTISEYVQHKKNYTEIIKIVIANPHPVVKIQGIAAINRTIGLEFSTLSSDDEEDTFENHEEFQQLAVQLIQSMVSPDASDLSGLLVRCLSSILIVDPMIVYSTSAMDLAIHFLSLLPEHPDTRHTLSHIISSILPKLCSEGQPDAPSSIREKNFQWLQAVLNMVKTASQRPKGDPLITVSTAVLNPFLIWWVGPLPSGTVGSVFPALAGILLQEDDSSVLVMGQKVLSVLISKGYQEISQWKSSDGKTGLEVLMMVIEQGLDPSLDESQRVFSGPLISDLLQKAAGELQPILPMLLKVMITQLSTAKEPEFIQSLIQVFATLIVMHPPDEILSFCSTFHESGQSGLEILLKIWTETFEVIQGYNQIRLSVLALSRVFEVGIDGIMVKGDEITEPSNSGRIVTRSLRKKLQWTSVPVKLKILKLLIRELANISEGEEGNGRGGEGYGGGSVENGDGWESDDDDDNDWENVTGEIGSETGEDDAGLDVSEDVLRGVNTKAFIIDFLRKVAASGERWELSDSEVATLKFNRVI